MKKRIHKYGVRLIAETLELSPHTVRRDIRLGKFELGSFGSVCLYVALRKMRNKEKT